MFRDVRAVFSKILISVTRDIALDQIVVAELEFKLEIEGSSASNRRQEVY